MRPLSSRMPGQNSYSLLFASFHNPKERIAVTTNPPMLTTNGNSILPTTIPTWLIKRKRWSRAIIPKITDAILVNGFISLIFPDKDNTIPIKVICVDLYSFVFIHA